jgi:hypothetical protein
MCSIPEEVSDGISYHGCCSQESCKCKMAFKGHTDYLHSVVVREANRQVLCSLEILFDIDLAYILYHLLLSVSFYFFLFQVVTGSEDGTARIWGEQ